MDKLYFSGDEPISHYLAYYLKYARHEGLESITLIEALESTDKSMIWCSEYGYAKPKHECNNGCPQYYRTNGRFCDFRSKPYAYGRKVTFNVKTGKEIK